MVRPSDSVITRLINTVGESTAQTIIDEFGGERPYIPRRIRYDGRDEFIKQDYSEIISTGQTCMEAYRRLSEEYGLSIRRIREIARE